LRFDANDCEWSCASGGFNTEDRERISKEGREGNRKIEDDDEDEHEDERAQGTLLAVQYFRPE